MVNVLLKTYPGLGQGRLSPRYARGVVALAAITALMLAVPRVSSASGDPNPAPGDCQVVSDGLFYCNINGSYYYCNTSNNPDPVKDCYPDPGRRSGPVRTPSNVFVPPTNVGTLAPPTSTSTGTSSSSLTNRAASTAASSTLVK